VMYHNSKMNAMMPDGVDSVSSQGLGELIDHTLLFLRRRFITIGVVTALVLSLAVIYLRVTPPTFTATAQVMLDVRKSQLDDQRPLNDGQLSSPQIESFVQVVKSENVISAVVKSLRLYDDPEFVAQGTDSSPLSALHFFSGSQTVPLDESERIRRAIAVLTKNLDVVRVGASYVVELSYSSRGREKSANIVNAVADAFMAEQIDVENRANHRANEWLLDRLEQLGQQADAAERAAVAFKQSNNIVSVSGNLINDQELTALNGQLTAARQKTDEALARWKQVDAIVASNSPSSPIDASVPGETSNPILTKLRQQYLDLATRQAEWSKKYGPDHQAVINLVAQMRGIRTAMLDEIRRLDQSYQSDYEVAKQGQETIEKQLASSVAETQTTNRAQVKLRELEATAQSYRSLYETFLKRSTEASQTESFPMSAARLISRAPVPLQKAKPKTILILLLGAIGGLVVGVAAGLVRDLRESQLFRTTEEVEAKLQIPCVAVVPHAPAIAQPEPKEPFADVGSFKTNRVIVGRDHLSWAIATQPFGRFAEALRSVKLSLDLAWGGSSRKRVVGFISALPKEGKSTLSVGFGLLVSQAGRRVILVDLDLRNPTATKTLAPHADNDLIDVLSAKCSLDDAIWIEPTSGMAFLPGCVKARTTQSSEILGSRAMETLFEELRRRYEYVVVDLPPLAPIIDARITTHLVDSYFLVVAWGRTKTKIVTQALGSARNMSDGLIGAVLNNADVVSMGRYDGHSHDYYGDPAYSAYGLTE
jgi:polysaccharide biosynthesis transport protein